MDRPFIAAMAMIRLFPWQLFPPFSASEPPANLVAQRDLLFHLAQNALQHLYFHLTDETFQKGALRKVNDQFCQVVFRCFMRCPGFTVEEKLKLHADGNWEPSYRTWAEEYEMPMMVTWAKKAGGAALSPTLPSPAASEDPSKAAPPTPALDEEASKPEEVMAASTAALEPEAAPAPTVEKEEPAPAAAGAEEPVAVAEPAPASPAPKAPKAPRERKTTAITTSKVAAEPSEEAAAPESPQAEMHGRKGKKNRPETPKNKKSATPPVHSPVPPAEPDVPVEAPKTEAPVAAPAPAPTAVTVLSAEVEEQPAMPRAMDHQRAQTSASVPSDILAASLKPQTSEKRSRSVGDSPREPMKPSSAIDDSISAPGLIESATAENAPEPSSATSDRGGSPTRAWNLEAKEFEVVEDADIILQEEPSPPPVTMTLGMPPPGHFVQQAPPRQPAQQVDAAAAAAAAARARQQPQPAGPAAFPPPPAPQFYGYPPAGPFPSSGVAAAPLPPHPQAMLPPKPAANGPMPSGAFVAPSYVAPPPTPGAVTPASPTAAPATIPTLSPTATFLQHLISDRLMSEQQYRQMLYSQIERNHLEQLEAWYQSRRSVEVDSERRRWNEVESIVADIWHYTCEGDYPAEHNLMDMLKGLRVWSIERARERGAQYGMPRGAPPPPPGYGPPPGMQGYHGGPPHLVPGAAPKPRGFVDPAIVSYRTNSPHSSVSSAGELTAVQRDSSFADGSLASGSGDGQVPAPFERANTGQTMVDFSDEQLAAAGAGPHDGSGRIKGGKPGRGGGGHRYRSSEDRTAFDAEGGDGHHDRGSRRGRGRSGDKHLRSGGHGWSQEMTPDEYQYPGQREAVMQTIKAKQMESGARRS